MVNGEVVYTSIRYKSGWSFMSGCPVQNQNPKVSYNPYMVLSSEGVVLEDIPEQFRRKWND